MASRNASFHDGVLTGILLAPPRLLLGIVVLGASVLLLAWTIDWIFVFEVWPEGVSRLKALRELESVRGGILADRLGVPDDIFDRSANLVYQLIFGFTGVHDMAVRFADPVSLSVPDTAVRGFYMRNWEAIEAAMVGTQLIGVRLTTSALLSPIAVLGYVVAMTDGFVQRAIRRAAGGRESASLYHRAKHMQVSIGSLGLVTVLVWPAPVNWLLVSLVMTAVIATLARFQWAYYKKHL